MDQNYDFQQNYQQAPPAKKDSSYFRERARKALQNCYWYAVLAAFLIGILGAGVESGTSVQFNNVDTTTLQSTINTAVEAIAQGGIGEIFRVFPGFGIALIFAGLGATAGFAFRLLVGSPIKLGYERYKLNLIDGNGKDLKVLFSYFKQNYAKSIVLHLLLGLIGFAIYLPLIAGTVATILVSVGVIVKAAASEVTAQDGMLLILMAMGLCLLGIVTAIVRIIFTYRYSFCYTIMAEYPEISPVDALRNSANLMKGKKWKLFCLNFSFIGWLLLAACCSCGVGSLFLTPYIDTAVIAFYDDITNRGAAKDVEFPSLNPDDYDPNYQGF